MASDGVLYEVVCNSEDREAWLVARRSGIGASEAPGVMGESKWSSPTSIQADKMGLLPDKEGELLEAGRRLEPFIAEWALEEMEKKGAPFGYLLRSKPSPWMLATPDWIVHEKDEEWGPIEVPFQIKNTMIAEDWKEGVPTAVEIQVQQELYVTGAPWGYVAVLLTGNRLRWKRIERDPELIGRIVDGTHALWEKIQNHELVEADGSNATKLALKAMHPDDNGKTIELDGKALACANKLIELKAEHKALEASIDERENHMRSLLGDNSYGSFSDGSGYSLKTQTRKETLQKAATFRVLRRQQAKS